MLLLFMSKYCLKKYNMIYYELSIFVSLIISAQEKVSTADCGVLDMNALSGKIIFRILIMCYVLLTVKSKSEEIYPIITFF